MNLGEQLYLRQRLLDAGLGEETATEVARRATAAFRNGARAAQVGIGEGVSVYVTRPDEPVTPRE